MPPNWCSRPTTLAGLCIDRPQYSNLESICIKIIYPMEDTPHQGELHHRAFPPCSGASATLRAVPELVLLRHGQSTWNAENLFTGWVDVDLSPAGEAEARAAGELLAVEAVRRLGRQQLSGRPGFGLARRGQVDVDPAGEQVLGVPGRLPVA